MPSRHCSPAAGGGKRIDTSAAAAAGERIRFALQHNSVRLPDLIQKRWRALEEIVAFEDALVLTWHP